MAKEARAFRNGGYSLPLMSELAAETHMTGGQKITNLIGVTVPFAGFLASVFFLWGSYVTWRDLTIFAVGYVLTTLGISIGFHRLFTHRSYETYRAIRYSLAVLGSMAVQGPVIRWVSDHRKHHSFADREGDPHSPHAGFGPGIRGKIAGLWHAHVGWLFRNVGRAEWTKYAKDLLADRGMVFVSRMFPAWVAVSLLLPFAAGWIWGGTFGAGLQAMFWGGLIRIFLLHHITWSVNSVCHFIGSRRFRVKDESRNVWWLSWISFGESWHHNHHAFPSSAFHGLKPWELDIGGLVIRLLRRLGLVWKVNVPTPEMQQRRREALS
jgi:stearoyl-CoA desaturase (Delta-9 desaturase)